MQKSQILIYVESRYKVNRKRIKATIQRVLDENNVTTPVEVSIAIVGDRKMRALNKKYRNLDKTTNVLSFPLAEGEDSHPGDDIMRLGDVVVSYPVIIQEAARDEMLVDEKVDELLAHGMLHLLGLHHE
jgi:probable rRNA maturation factor